MAKAENENRRDPIHLVWMVKKVPKLDRALGLAGRPYSPCRQGSILLAGTANISGPSSGYEFALAQFTSNGMPDSSFGDGGTVLDDFDNHDNHATAVALQSDDGILVAGYSDGGSLDLVRYLPDGTLDTTFANGGRVSASSPSPINVAAGTVTSVAIQPNNQILVGGSFAQYYVNYLGVARFNVDGSPDDSFGDSGIAYDTGIASSSAAEIAIQPDGSVVAAGFSGEIGTPGAAGNVPVLARLTAGDIGGASVCVVSDHASR